MGRSSPRKVRRKKSHQPFLEKGLNALILGAGLWLIPAFMSGKPLLGIKSTLQMLAWFLMGIGLLLLGIHYLLKNKAGDGERVEPKFAPQRPSRSARPAQLEETAIWHAVAPEMPSPNTTSTALTEWSSAVFKAIEWRRFEAVCEVLFSQAGFEARTQSHGPDGGVDVWLHSKHAQGAASVVQCKHWRSRPVGVKEVREFFGVMASHQLKRGTYATTSTFTTDAVDFAKRNGIHLLDGTGLLKLIAQRTPEQQQALLAVAFEGDYARPTCASCGIKMVERTPSKGGSAFWGCKNYPRCHSRLGMIAS
jgi:restriction system protein